MAADWLFFAAMMLPFLGIAIAIWYAGYFAYETAKLRERAASLPTPADPLVELARLEVETVEDFVQARETLARTQTALERGIRG